MAIPKVPLNVDPGGYAGGILQDINLPGGGGAAGGMLPGIGDFLNRIVRSREALAKAQLAMMQEELAGARERRQQVRADRYRVKAAEQGEHAVDPAKELQSIMLQNVRGAGGTGGTLADWAQRQSRKGMAGFIGGLLSGQTGRTDILPYTPQPGFVPPPETPRYSRTGPGLPAWYFGGPESSTAPMVAAQRRTGRPIRGGSYSIVGEPEKPWRGFRKGGTVPKTGTYRLHKGELVMSPEDVERNPDMVMRLVRQKLTERIRKGKPEGSYQGGSVEKELIDAALEGDVASLRQVLGEIGIPESEADRVINEATRNRGRVIPKTARIRNIEEYLKGRFREGAPVVPTIPTGLANLYAQAREAPSTPPTPVPEGRWPLEALLGGIPGRAIGKVGEMPMGEALGEAIREQIGGLRPRVIGEALGETGFMRGLVGPGEEILGVGAKPEVTTPPGGDEEAAKQIADALMEEAGQPTPGEPAEGSIEAALARVQEGDLGTPEEPLTVRGELSEMEQAQRDIEGIPAYQEARRKAQTAETESERIFDMLRLEGHRLDPDVYTDLYREGERKMKLADKFQAIVDRREKASEAYLSSTAKALDKLTHDITLERERVAGKLKVEEVKGERILTAAMVRPYAASLPRLYATAASGSPRERAEAQRLIAQVLMAVVSVTRPDVTASEEDAAKWSEQFANMPPNEMMALAQSMIAQLRD